MKRLVKDPWFKDKTIGWGLSPARWQGWALTAGFCAVMCATAFAPFPFMRLRGVAWNGVAVGVSTGFVAIEVIAFIAAAVLTSTWLKRP